MAEIKLTINGKECTAPAGSTILQAAERNGIHIPKLCYLEGIHQYGACRICVVEQISPPAKNLQASCMSLRPTMPRCRKPGRPCMSCSSPITTKSA